MSLLPAPLIDLWHCYSPTGKVQFSFTKEEKLLVVARCIVAALTAFALYQGAPVVATALLSAAITLPAAVMTGGAFLSYYGAMGVISCIASKSFAGLGISLLKLFGGYIIVHNYSCIEIGLLDLLLSSKTD